MLIYGKRLSKMKLFLCQEFFLRNFGFINGCKNEFLVIMKNHAGDPEKGVPHKVDFEAVWARSGDADSVGVKNKLLLEIKIVLRLNK